MPSLVTNPTVRDIARRLHLTTLIQRLRRGDEYEHVFRDALRAAIKPGDIVWDVGANGGHYTSLFSEWVGPAGRVDAFEPATDVRATLVALDLPNVTVHAEGLGSHKTIEPLRYGNTWNWVSCAVVPGDSLELPQPQVIKLDVDGLEEEALHGMQRTLGGCRAVFSEIHFRILQEVRGQKQAPRRIEQYLSGLGFDLEWVDTSHLAARR